MHLLHSTFPSLVPNTTQSLSSVAAATIMYSFTSLIVVGSFAVQTALGFPSLMAWTQMHRRHPPIVKRSVDAFLATEQPYALREILCALGSDGCNAEGVASGLLIASPGMPCMLLMVGLLC